MTRVFRDVGAQVIQLLGVAYLLVESVVLPEVARAPYGPVDLDGGVMFPGGALLQHLLRRRKSRDQMDVVRHDHEVGEEIAVAVKETEAVGHDAGQVGPPEYTGPVTIIQGRLPSGREAAMKLMAGGDRQSSQALAPAVVP